jgi:hypothetical protein
MKKLSLLLILALSLSLAGTNVFADDLNENLSYSTAAFIFLPQNISYQSNSSQGQRYNKQQINNDIAEYAFDGNMTPTLSNIVDNIKTRNPDLSTEEIISILEQSLK